MTKFFLTVSSILLLVLSTHAQSRTITGQVTNDNGQGISKASIVVKGTTLGTTTGNDGSFSLTVPSGSRTLVVSYVGLADKEIDLTAGQSNYSISLSQSNKTDMQEVILVAYGTAKKGSITNSVAQVTAKDLENRPVTNVISSLAGVAPGISSTGTNGQPGSSAAIRIRGFGSINGSNNPLYVVDGAPYDYDISNINVDDIENVSILKDASASSLYGSRAANGVIQITTKKGKMNRAEVRASIAQGFISRAMPEYDRLNAFQYYPAMWEAYRNSLLYPATGTGLPLADANKIATGLFPRFTTGANAGRQNYNNVAYLDISQLLGYNPFSVAKTDIVRTDGTLNPAATLIYEDLDWLKDIQRDGSRGDYTVSISGGAAKSDYYFSLGYTDEKAFVRNSDYKRYSARLNLNTQALSWFKTGVTLNAILTQANQGASDGSSTGLVNPFYTSRVMGPIYPVHLHDPVTGAYILDGSGNLQYDYIGSGRPVAGGRHAIYETILNQNLLKRNVLSGRVFGEISFLKNFKFTTNVSADLSTSLRSQYENKIVGDGAPAGRSRRNTTDNITLTINQLLNYNKTHNKHSIDVLVGHENFDATYRSVTTLKSGQIVDGNTELSNFITLLTLSSNRDMDKIESYLSRVNYGFNNKYFVQASFRRDGSSRFGPDVRWGNFWSASAGWRIDQEKFMDNVSWLEALKLRASYGEVGNNALLDDAGNDIYYAYQSFYNLGSNNNNNTEAGAVQSTTVANPMLTWEVNKQFDVGLEFGLFKNRINGTLEFFDRKSSNLLFNVPPPVSSGGLSAPKNIGTMYNRGYELSINGDILRNKNLVWNLALNVTTFKNRITTLPDHKKIASSASSTQQWEEGYSRYDFYVRDWYGVDPTDGAALYVMNTYNAANTRVLKNGDSVTIDQANAKMHYAGSAIPDFFGSIINNFSFKGFNLFVQLNYQVGGLIFDDTYRQLMHSGSYGVASHVDILKRWQAPGDITDVPRLDGGKNTAFSAISDRWLTDASFLNIQNVTLSYLFPRKISNKLSMQNLKLYVSGENLYMFTKRKGMNPIQNFTGVTSNVYIPSRTITAGITLSL